MARPSHSALSSDTRRPRCATGECPCEEPNRSCTCNSRGACPTGRPDAPSACCTPRSQTPSRFRASGIPWPVPEPMPESALAPTSSRTPDHRAATAPLQALHRFGSCSESEELLHIETLRAKRVVDPARPRIIDAVAVSTPRPAASEFRSVLRRCENAASATRPQPGRAPQNHAPYAQGRSRTNRPRRGKEARARYGETVGHLRPQRQLHRVGPVRLRPRDSRHPVGHLSLHHHHRPLD